MSPQIKQIGSYFNHPCFQGEPWGRFRRIFSWGDGYQYIAHRPPTVINAHGTIIHKFRKLDITSSLGIYMHHYSVFSIKNWTEKLQYYRNQEWSYDQRNGLSISDLLNQKKWSQISNQYNTFNTLETSKKSIEMINKIYEKHSDEDTKLIVNSIIQEFPNTNLIANINFLIMFKVDAIFRNAFHPFRKLISKIFLIVDKILFELGIRESMNELRQRSNKLN